MANLDCLLLTPAQSEAVAGFSADRSLRIEPRLLAAGEDAGAFVLPARLLSEWLDRFPARIRALALSLPRRDIDPDTAWPPATE